MNKLEKDLKHRTQHKCNPFFLKKDCNYVSVSLKVFNVHFCCLQRLIQCFGRDVCFLRSRNFWHLQVDSLLTKFLNGE